MDYLQIYKVQFDKTWLEIKNQTIKELKLAKRNKKNFNKVYNSLLKTLNEESEQMYNQFESDGYNRCIGLFQGRYSEYENDLYKDEIIELSLMNEVKSEFETLSGNDYKSFIQKVSKLMSLNEIKNHFKNYSNYYELIYDLDYYKYFHAKNFERISFESSKEYKEMVKIKYPNNSNQPTGFDVIDPSINISETFIGNVNVNNTGLSTRDSIQNEFSLKERAILIHLLKYRFKELKLTEIIKVILIIGATDQFEIFEVKSASNSYLYKQAHKGYSVFKSKELRSKISELGVKLKNHGLQEIEAELKIDFSNHLNKK